MNDKKFIKTKVQKTLKKIFGKSYLSHYELVRLNILSNLVSCILVTGESKLHEVASGNPERKKFSSKVKQYKRFVQNRHVDCKTYYLPYMKELLAVIGKSGNLVFAIDGSQVGNGCMCLMFSVLYRGRAIPVVWEVYKAKKGHLSEIAHCTLLGRLSELVSASCPSCRVVIVGDGEFDGCKWQEDILAQGWDYVLRTSKSVEIECEEGEVFKPTSICLEKGEELFFEGIGFTAKRLSANLLIWHGKEYEDPLILVTNLYYVGDIKQFYKKRFLIETFFRDQKSKGFNIHKSGLSCPERLSRLLIATCMAYVLCIMSGLKALKSRFYDEITRTDGDFLSLFQLGRRFIEFLVDIRQWRAFSWRKDFEAQKPIPYNCVPF